MAAHHSFTPLRQLSFRPGPLLPATLLPGFLSQVSFSSLLLFFRFPPAFSHYPIIFYFQILRLPPITSRPGSSSFAGYLGPCGTVL